MKKAERIMQIILIVLGVVVVLITVVRCGYIAEQYQKSKGLYEELIKQKEKSIDLLKCDLELSEMEKEQLQRKFKDKDSYVYDFDETEVNLLARCVEAEAGENNFESQKYVAQVILNRLHSDKFPNTLEGVIYQKVNDVPQFSVAYDGRLNREVKSETLANVYSVLLHGTDLPEYVLYFYSMKVKNNWVNSLPTHSVVEGTVFAYEEGSKNE